MSFLGQHEHGTKIATQSTTRHEIIRAGLARPEGGPGPGLKFRPVGLPTWPAQMGRAWAGTAQ
jgi:hypothetical protein